MFPVTTYAPLSPVSNNEREETSASMTGSIETWLASALRRLARKEVIHAVFENQ